jgi:hypothetical protein
MRAVKPILPGMFMLFILLAMLSCQRHSDESLSELDRKIEAFIPKERLQQAHYVLLIPGAGCTGCIGVATMFVKDHIPTRKDLFVIFTKIQDMKTLKMQLGPDIRHSPNIFYDSTGVLNDPRNENIYPKLIKCENAKVVNISDFDNTLAPAR